MPRVGAAEERRARVWRSGRRVWRCGRARRSGRRWRRWRQCWRRWWARGVPAAVGDGRGDGGSLRIVVAEDDLIIRIAATCAVNLRRLIGRRACIGSSAVADAGTRTTVVPEVRGSAKAVIARLRGVDAVLCEGRQPVSVGAGGAGGANAGHFVFRLFIPLAAHAECG